MTVTFSGEQYPCTRAVKDGSSATLYLEQGGCVTFSGVNRWDAFTLEGGDWSLPDVTPEERLRADVDFIAAMTGVMLV